MARKKDVDWNLPDGNPTHWEAMHAALLMDLRDLDREILRELKSLNATFHCHNFLSLPRTIRTIERRLAKKIPLREP